MFKKTITRVSIIAIVIGFIFLANGLILAWTAPTTSPPDGNVNPPINVSSDSQYKAGALGVGGVFHGYSNGIFDGTVYATGFYYSSDRALKQNIQPISDVLEKIKNLEGVSFDWKDSGMTSLGLISQDVEEQFPELVSIDESTGLKYLQYGNLVAPLIEAVKALILENEIQTKEIEALKAKITN